METEETFRLYRHCDERLIDALNDPELKSFLPSDVKVECRICPYEGSYSPDTKTISICAQSLTPFQSILKQSIKHEAIHAIDEKYSSLFSDPCLFRACTEIRAAKFSGQCSSLLRDFIRLTLPDFEGCVYKKAKKSHDMYEPCRSKSSVDDMWNFCFNSDLYQDLSNAETKSKN
jgi:inner membrane protease ATP23